MVNKTLKEDNVVYFSILISEFRPTVFVKVTLCAQRRMMRPKDSLISPGSCWEGKQLVSALCPSAGSRTGSVELLCWLCQRLSE